MDALVNECSVTGGTSMELTSAELASYQRIAEQGPVPVGEMTSDGQGGISVHAVDNLIAAGLVRRLGNDHLAAVDPAGVSDQLLEKWEERVRGAQFDLLWMRSQFAELKLIYATQQQPAQGPQLERIDSHDELVRALERQAAECRQEVLSARPGGPRQDAELLEARHRYQSLLGREVRLRTLYQYSTRFDPLTAQEAIDAGAEVRTVTGDLARFIIFDRKVLFIPLQDGPGGALVIRNSDLITFAAEMFNSLWLTGDLLNKPRDRTFIHTLANQTKQSILQHLIDGADDRTTARALGISVRTCQRHVSEMMRQVGASSRLQLGFLLREQEPVAW
ncbi:LuxR C-terminal-related transcriptional regulator [Streptomyces sp. NPDC048644]|uniref:LuxR C-terminal-related transcriptional regulator n=1 Tax=Streptomyces sp. NPDC048644 TaxID=3365582 RepID=UPI00371E406D